MRGATLIDFNAENRSARLSFASETPVRDYWYGKEILRVNDTAMGSERFKAGVMPVLFNHNKNQVIARVDKLWTENGRAYADITFDDDDFSENIMRKVASGSLRGVSVGYDIMDYSILKRDETSSDGIEGPALIGDKWEAFEISIVSIPADASVGVGRSRLYDPNYFRALGEGKEPEPEDGDNSEAKNASESSRAKNDGEQQDDKKGDGEKMTPEEREALEREAKATAKKEEFQRQNNIRILCRNLKIEEKDMDEMLNDATCTIEKANERALAIMQERYKPTDPPKGKVTEDEADKKRAAIVDGLFLRHGGVLEKPAPGADEFRNRRFVDIARMVLEDAGERGINVLTERELLKRALTTTSALASIADNIAHKSMSSGYVEVGTTYQEWTQTGSNSDFKLAKRYLIYDAMAPVQIQLQRTAGCFCWRTTGNLWRRYEFQP